MCHVARWCIWCDSLMYVTRWWLSDAWLAHLFDLTRSYVSCDSCIRVTWLVDMCGVTRSYMWRDSLMCHSLMYSTGLVRMCHVICWYVSRDSFVCVTWLVAICDSCRPVITLRVTCLNEMRHIYERNMSHIRRSHATHIRKSVANRCETTCYVPNINESCHIHAWYDSFIYVTIGHGILFLSQKKKRCGMTYDWVTWHMKTSHATMSWSFLTGHVTYMCDMTLSYMWQWVMAYLPRQSPSHVTHKKQSRHTSQWVGRSSHNKGDEMPLIDISTSHVAEFNESRCRYQRVMLHIATSLCATSHVAHSNESCCT